MADRRHAAKPSHSIQLFMNTDNTFAALIQPGEANNFFDIQGLGNFDPSAASSYNRTNALWLSEFCRLIYRQEKDEIPTRADNFLRRDQILSPKGWRELRSDFFNTGDSQAAVFTNENLNCAVLV